MASPAEDERQGNAAGGSEIIVEGESVQELAWHEGYGAGRAECMKEIERLRKSYRGAVRCDQCRGNFTFVRAKSPYRDFYCTLAERDTDDDWSCDLFTDGDGFQPFQPFKTSGGGH
jgi:hypothetical protein